MFSSSGVDPPDAESAASRPRNRRPNVAAGASSATSSSSSFFSGGLLSPTLASRSYSSLQASPRDGGPGGGFGGLRSPTASSWVPNWSSIQDFASTLLAGNGSPSGSGSGSGSGTRSRSAGGRVSQARGGASSRKLPAAWGPAPPDESSSSASSSSRPRIQDVAAGQVAARDAELKARKTASVLESHPGVNGGLDVRGKFKRRSSDEDLRGSAAGAAQDVEDCLAYIHRVQATDTYFGIILKYRCHEDAFRKANGLWSRDNIQIRKWVALPVDACEIKGRPCDDPSLFPQGIDLLASTPRSAQSSPAQVANSVGNSDYFGTLSVGSGKTAIGNTTKSTSDDATEPLWAHVRWVRLDSSPNPVEIVRMSRTSFGYFPPRRKKSIRGSVSSVSTPRASLDISMSNSSLPERAIADSPNHSSRRPSLLGNRVVLGTSPMSSSPSRHQTGLGRTSAPVDPRPEWMRRPGGVGSMGKSVRTPGPAQDSLNKWTTKHLPGFNIETLPSMSVMGSETAHFGFGDDTPGIVESSFEDGRGASTSAQIDSGLDKAAASIETWLRGAFAKQPGTSSAASGTHSTSFAGRIGRQLEETLGDLIELEDGPREEGGSGGSGGVGGGSSSSSSRQAVRPNPTTGWQTDSEGSIRGRSTVTGAGRASATAKGKKAD